MLAAHSVEPQDRHCLVTTSTRAFDPLIRSQCLHQSDHVRVDPGDFRVCVASRLTDITFNALSDRNFCRNTGCVFSFQPAIDLLSPHIHLRLLSRP